MNAEKEARIKSWILMIAGMAGVGYQQYTGETDWVLLLIFIAMIGIPGYTEIISILKSSPTVSQSLPSLPSVSEQESQSSVNESSREGA